MRSKMKKLLFFIVILFFANISFAQIHDNRFEISGSIMLGSFSTAYKTKGYSSNTEGKLYLNTSLKIGYFIFEGLEIEPEVYSYILEKSKPSFLLNCNLAYNYHIERSNFYPFILAGYGVGNSLPFLATNAYLRTSDKFDIGVLNAGAGLKYFITTHVGIRIEYRYQKYKDNIEEYSNGDTYKGEFDIKFSSFYLASQFCYKSLTSASTRQRLRMLRITNIGESAPF